MAVTSIWRVHGSVGKVLDYVENAEELIPRYRRQLSLYRQALEKATPYPVRESALYSLRLDQSVTVL